MSPSVTRPSFVSVHPRREDPLALRPHLSAGLPLSGCVFEHNYIYGNPSNFINFFYYFFNKNRKSQIERPSTKAFFSYLVCGLHAGRGENRVD